MATALKELRFALNNLFVAEEADTESIAAAQRMRAIDLLSLAEREDAALRAGSSAGLALARMVVAVLGETYDDTDSSLLLLVEDARALLAGEGER